MQVIQVVAQTATNALPTSPTSASPTLVNITYNTAPASSDERMVAILDRLNSRLNEPFVTVNTVDGDHGIKQAQVEYARLMKNNSLNLAKNS